MNAVHLGELEAQAADVLSAPTFAYFAGGAADELTLADNRAAWERLRLVPHVLRADRPRTAETSLLGLSLAAPVLTAPLAYQRMAHDEGDVAIAAGAAGAGVGQVLSSLSSHRLEDVAAAGRDPLFQLYPYRDRGQTAEIVARAQDAGFRALVVTVDVPVHGRRERETLHGFSLAPGVELPNVPVPPSHTGPVTPHDVTSWMQADLGWGDVERFLALTDLPVLLKGVLHPDDAARAAELGAAGIVVSNHGGRQLDTAVASADALPAIADAAGDLTVLVDGGVRRGTDVVKALALGADAVLVGRPVTWALALEGAAGVRWALGLLVTETAEALALCGCASPADVQGGLLFRP